MIFFRRHHRTAQGGVPFRPGRRTWPIACVSGFAMVLLLLIVCKSLPFALAERAPNLAMRLDPTIARARLVMATAILGEASDPAVGKDRAGQLARARRLAIAALRHDPLNTRALEILGQISAETGDDAVADTFMLGATTGSLRRRTALYWMTERSFAGRDYAATARYADALLRGYPKAIALVAPTLVHMMEHQAAQPVLVNLLAAGPPWRARFFTHLRGPVTNVSAPLKILLALQNTAHPPTNDEIGVYLRFLIDKRNADMAYYSWLQLLPAERLVGAGWLYNGRFSFPISGLPFDWEIPASTGAVVDVVPRGDRPGQYALAIETGPGRVDFHPVQQTLALPTGRYTLSGLVKGHVRGARGFRWTVGCSQRPAQVGATQMFVGDRPHWSLFSAVVVVPETCRLQTLKLILDARSASETMVSGSLRFADLAIRRD